MAAPKPACPWEGHGTMLQLDARMPGKIRRSRTYLLGERRCASASRLRWLGNGWSCSSKPCQQVTRVAVLANPGNASTALQLQETQVAAQALGMQLQVVEIQSPDAFENAFAAVT